MEGGKEGETAPHEEVALEDGEVGEDIKIQQLRSRDPGSGASSFEIHEGADRLLLADCIAKRPCKSCLVIFSVTVLFGVLLVVPRVQAFKLDLTYNSYRVDGGYGAQSCKKWSAAARYAASATREGVPHIISVADVASVAMNATDTPRSLGSEWPERSQRGAVMQVIFARPGGGDMLAR